MKKEFSTKPEKIKEAWTGLFNDLSWKEMITAIPTTMFVVTGWKANGKENACLHQFSSFFTDSGEFICVMGWVSKNGHMYKSLKETGCCVLNFPSSNLYSLCLKTCENNQYEANEITDSGLTSEKAIAVNAPRIAECFLNIECVFLWEQQNFEQSDKIVVALKAVHICMDSDRYDQKKLGRYGKTGYTYNIYGSCNPDTGEAQEDGFWITEFSKIN